MYGNPGYPGGMGMGGGYGGGMGMGGGYGGGMGGGYGGGMGGGGMGYNDPSMWNNYHIQTCNISKHWIQQNAENVFMRYDTSRMGQIPIQMLPTMLQEVSIANGSQPPSPMDCQYMMYTFDFNGDGMLSYYEWIRALKMMGGYRQYDRNYLMANQMGGGYCQPSYMMGGGHQMHPGMGMGMGMGMHSGMHPGMGMGMHPGMNPGGSMKYKRGFFGGHKIKYKGGFYGGRKYKSGFFGGKWK